MKQPRAMKRRSRKERKEHQSLPSRAALLPSPSLQTYHFERSESIGALTIPTSDGAFSWNWTLSDLPNVTEITALFQEYRVDLITVTLQWNSASGTTSVYYPVVYMLDTTSGVVPPSTLNDYLQRPYKKAVFNQSQTEHSFSVRPCIRAGADVAGTVGGRVVQLCPWLASSSTLVTLHGMSAWIANYNTTAAPGTITAIARIKFSARGLA